MGNPDNSFSKPVAPEPAPGETVKDANGFFEGGDTTTATQSPADTAGHVYFVKPESKDVPPVPSAPSVPDSALIPVIEGIIPGTTQTAIVHTLEAAGLVAISFVLTALVGSIGHLDVSHWQPLYQALWTYALPTIVLGIQSALKMVEAQKQTVLAQKTMNAAKSMMKSINLSKSVGGTVG